MSEDLLEEVFLGHSNLIRQCNNDHILDPDRWDWANFHERGLQLTRWLKEEGTYRIVYCKPVEDPDFKKDEYREILADGTPLYRSIVTVNILI